VSASSILRLRGNTPTKQVETQSTIDQHPLTSSALRSTDPAAQPTRTFRR
jgi:hypothetical protein